MSEHIPQYIGSKLGAFQEDDVAVVETPEHHTEDIDQESESDSQPFQPPKESKVMLNKRKKSPTGKVKKSRKKTGEGAMKSLPVNPGAVKQADEDIPPIPVAELPDLEALVAPTAPEEIESIEPNLAESLKSLTGKKKKTPRAKKVVKKPTRAAKKDVLVETTTSEDIGNNKLDELSSASEPESQVEEIPVPAVEKKPVPSPEVKAPVVKETVVASPVETKVPVQKNPTKPIKSDYSQSDEIEERRAYVQRLKDETHSFLKQLAIEREERVKSLAKLRKDIREQLAQK